MESRSHSVKKEMLTRIKGVSRVTCEGGEVEKEVVQTSWES